MKILGKKLQIYHLYDTFSKTKKAPVFTESSAVIIRDGVVWSLYGKLSWAVQADRLTGSTNIFIAVLHVTLGNKPILYMVGLMVVYSQSTPHVTGILVILYIH